ncbi:MAG: hypothetical protein V2J25_07950 [Desulfatiglans sp.]|jgi:hypothetical protein|nr:hypothetical protein [Thermodesulfobacteriota bacterium]MEE4352785.1 hypothetical protein [Desulfatiglans sp.]
MTKATISALYSALVIPGLGQINNQQLKKGGVILLLVFVLIVAGAVKLYYIMQSVASQTRNTLSDYGSVKEMLKAGDLAILWGLLALFAMIWLYSLIDAYITGRGIDQIKGRHLP